MIAPQADFEHTGFTGCATAFMDFYNAGQHLWRRAAAWLDGRTTQPYPRYGCVVRQGQCDRVLADIGEELEVEGSPDTAQDTLITVYAYLARRREHI